MISIGRTVIESEAIARLLHSKYKQLRAVRRGHIDRRWRRLETAQREERTVDATVIRTLDDGLLVDIGVPGFLPLAEMRTPAGDLGRFMGRTFGCQIQQLHALRGTVLLSQKDGQCSSLNYASAWELERLTCGQVLWGRITREHTVELVPGVEGEVVEPGFCIGELEEEEWLPASVRCEVGAVVRVRVLSTDRSQDKLTAELLD